MSISRNPFKATLHRIKALALRQRPTDLARRLRNGLLRTTTTTPVSPVIAWEAYKRSACLRSFADNGWLVQFGTHNFDRDHHFEFSLVRQLNTLEHWNDEYIQINLRMCHEITPTLASLKNWHDWSFKYRSPQDFFVACESRPAIRCILADNSAGWTWTLDVSET